MEIETLYKLLQQASKFEEKGREVDMQWLLLPLHSSITRDEQQRVFLPPRQGYRKIILATNIAESSITVNDVKYVIDFCLTKSLSCDPSTNYTCLRLEWASKFQAIQRKGRCGRVSEGTYFSFFFSILINFVNLDAIFIAIIYYHDTLIFYMYHL